jgi:hypothetical protein
MANIAVAPELWASCILPEGFIERWLVPNGTLVRAGDPLAEVRIEDGLHKIAAPLDGQLVIDSKINSIVEPSSVIGRVEPAIANSIDVVTQFQTS